MSALLSAGYSADEPFIEERFSADVLKLCSKTIDAIIFSSFDYCGNKEQVEFSKKVLEMRAELAVKPILFLGNQREKAEQFSELKVGVFVDDKQAKADSEALIEKVKQLIGEGRY